MTRSQAETLVNAIMAILFVVGLFAELVLWLMRSSHPAMAVRASP